jgi:hypothetical protein
MSVNSYERLLSASAVYVSDGWLPPEETCEALADLKAEHLRLLDATRSALQELADARRSVDVAAEARSEALQAAILAGRDAASVKADEPDVEAIAELERVYLASAAALEQFVNETRAEVVEREPEIREQLAEDLADADELRRQARELLAEADALAAKPEKMSNWLDRFGSRDYMGPLAYEDMPDPHIGPMPGSADLVLAEGEVMGIGSDFPTQEELAAQAIARMEAEDAAA